MAFSSTLSAPLRLTLTLLTLAVGSCSSGSTGEDAPTDGNGQHIDDPQAGSAGADDGDPDAGGTDAGSGSQGAGSTSGEPDPGAGAKAGTDSGNSGAGGGSAENPEPEPPSEEFLRGQELVEQNECVTCHQENFAGFTIFPNITPDEATGIGSWSDEQIVAAIRDGVDTDGKSMCSTMMRYSFEPDQLTDIVAFLRGIPAVRNKVTSQCPGHGQ
jgi:hypothetical protein